MADIQPLEEAINSIDARTPIGSELRSADWESVPLALRQRAQFSAGVTSARVLQIVQDRLAGQMKLQREQLANGKTASFDRSSFIDSVRGVARDEGLTPANPEDRGGVKDITSIPRLGLIFDMQNQMAAGFARNKLDTSEGALLLYPAYRLTASTAKEPRPEEWWQRRWFEAGESVAWEGAVKTEFVALKTSPIWSKLSRFGTPWAPFDWGSTRELEDVDREEAIALGLIQPDEILNAGGAGGEDFNDELQASVRGLDDKLKASLKDSFGKQVKFQGDTVWWTGDRKGKALAVGKTETPSPAENIPETAPVIPTNPQADALPDSLDSLKPERKLGGSTGATLMRDASGRQFVVKRGNSPAHIRDEFTADSLYRAAGVPVPRAGLITDSAGNPVKVAQFIQGQTLADYLRTASPADRQRIQEKLQEHFPVDALLGNWDVAGLNHDNIVVDAAGMPWRIDNGGALRYRAQGEAKTNEEWSQHPLDYWTMRAAQVNPKTAELFGGANAYDLAKRIQSVDFTRLIDAAPPDLREILAARARQLQDTARKALEYQTADFIAPHADRITEEIVRIRQAAITSEMAGALKQTDNKVQLEDSTGRRFDHLRSIGKSQPTATSDPADYFYQKIIPAVKTINGHHAKGDTEYNTPKVKEAIAQKMALEILKETGSAPEKKMAAKYLEAISQIEAASGRKDVILPNFKKFSGKLAGAASSAVDRSVIDRLAEHMETRGGDWNLVEKWASEQGGGSTSNASMQLKRWLFDRLEVPAAEFHNLPDKSVLKGIAGADRQKYDRTFEVFHGFIQELLTRLDFPGNDQSARLLRVLRTESNKSVVPFGKGKTGIYPRGVNESGSLFEPVFSGTRTMTAVPHARITSIYFLERTPGKGNTLLFGDSENEVTFMGHRLVTKNVTGKKPDDSPGNDSKQWQTP